MCAAIDAALKPVHLERGARAGVRMLVLGGGGTDASPRCQGLSCFLCLTAPPTASLT